MNYTLIRSKRKTCAIYIKGGAVEVRAPLQLSKKQIDRFVDSKSGWINKKLAESVSREEKRTAFALTYGGTVLYRGKSYSILSKPGPGAGMYEGSFYLPPDLTPEQIRYTCVQIYRHCARSVLTEKALAFAAKMGVSPASVKINGAKTRWGSCSGKRSLNFSWRLMMAEDSAIDYVIVHELAHLIEMNHSRKFWAQVERILPDYKERQASLKALQEKFRTENWEE